MDEVSMRSLEKQVAMISGGLGDIGRAIALELARRGADIAIGDVRDASAAHGVGEQLRELGVRSRYDVVDVADAAAVTAWIATIENALGVPTLIIPNAAIVTVA